MRIYDRSGFPNPARIRIVVAAKRLDPVIEFVSVDLIGAEHKQPEFLRLNPTGTLPVLELDDGTFISEATAITEYLDNLDGDPILTGRTPREKAVIHMMQRRAEADVADAVGHYFHFATPGLGPVLQPHKSPEWEGRASWGERERDRALASMRYFDSVLQDHAFVAGDDFSMADITLFAGLMFADAAGIAIPDLPSLRDWRVRVSDLPCVRERSGQSFSPDDLRRLGF